MIRKYLVGIENEDGGFDIIRKIEGAEAVSEAVFKFLSEGYLFDKILIAEVREFQFKVAIIDPIKSAAHRQRKKAPI